MFKITNYIHISGVPIITKTPTGFYKTFRPFSFNKASLFLENSLLDLTE